MREPDQAVVEYNILYHLYPKFAAIERCSVPGPIAVLPEIDAFLMEYVEGHILADDLLFVHYLFHRANFRELQDHFYDCGRWLRHFQQFTGMRTAGMCAPDNILLHCNDRLRVIEESGDRRCPRDFQKKTMSFIEKQVQELANEQIPVIGRHGNFGPWNILAGPHGVTIIDFFGFREDPLPVDVLSMLVHIECINHGIAKSGSRIRALRERFLAGLEPLPEMPQPLVLLRILHKSNC